ncbi:MAG: flagellar motor switch protein FliN [Phycisphaerales bacterium]|nr:MAG: flagellar motor switch protein FliN [Phycisphaerales bacterium]
MRAAREAIAAVNSGAAATPPVAQPSIDEARAEAEKLQPQTVPPNAHPFELQPLVDTGKNARPEGIDLLGDVNLDVKIELGRTRMFVEDVLRLKDGAVVELEKLAGDPVDVFVNERLIARGEVLVLNDNFCVRINEIVDQKAIEQARKHAS